MTVVDVGFDELDNHVLYALLRLRSEVFIVEQHCAYLDPDGRDVEPGTRHLLVHDAAGDVIAAARVLDDGEVRRIGRVVTRPDHRSHGLAARLLTHALATTRGPWVLDAQAHLAEWYARFGFTPTGPVYVDDGIEHVPMRRSG